MNDLRTMQALNISQLQVIHQLKDAAGHGLNATQLALLSQSGLLIDTCLRQVCIQPVTPQLVTPNLPATTEILHGHAAYDFLLQTMSGLNSSIAGETNVLGQFKCAWKRWQKIAPVAQTTVLNPLLEALCENTKQIRLRYLANMGGASYGSLARKILKPTTEARILFVGAGKFAQSMLPFFSAWKTALWNHRLHKNLHPAANTQLFSPAAADEAANWASILVLTTPAEDHNDRLWLERTRKYGIKQIMHLGRRRAEPGLWLQRPADIAFSDLDDVFELRQKQSTLRELNVLRARKACVQIALNVSEAEPTSITTPITTLVQRA
jgi:hypothetical protein